MKDFLEIDHQYHIEPCDSIKDLNGKLQTSLQAEIILHNQTKSELKDMNIYFGFVVFIGLILLSFIAIKSKPWK